MKLFQVVDLPKGNTDWKYYPVRPTDYTVSRKGQEPKTLRADLQRPLVLEVGDVLLYEGDLPSDFIELTRPSSSHGIYAVITTENQTQVTDVPRTEFVG